MNDPLDVPQAPSSGFLRTDPGATCWTPERIRSRADALGPWFHNLDLCGVRTAPDHFLFDFPAVKWASFRDHVPADLTGRTVLDIGCNGGFYSLEMKRRGADRVVAIDHDPHYLAQARFAAEVEGLDIEFGQLSVYDVAALGERFDVVLFLGVLYHLRHPLLALDLIHQHACADLLVFQTMQRGSEAIAPVAADYDFFAPAPFDDPGYPKLHFIEQSYAHDPTNWWAPNRAASAAMLRSAGFEITANPEAEIFLCRRTSRAENGAVYPAKAPGAPEGRASGRKSSDPLSKETGGE
ncbi:MAG: TIGR04290 family methyltransferase [Janthinobacterium lividum]